MLKRIMILLLPAGNWNSQNPKPSKPPVTHQSCSAGDAIKTRLAPIHTWAQVSVVELGGVRIRPPFSLSF